MTQRMLTALSTVFLTAVLAQPAQALSVSGSGAYNGKADIDGAGGAEAASSEYRLILNSRYFSAALKHTEYDFSGIDDPFDSLDHFAVDGRYDGSITSDLGFFTGLTWAAGFEDDIHLGDNYAVTPRAGLSWQFNPQVRFFFGGLAQFNEVDNQYLPILGVMLGREGDLGWSGSIAYPATKVTYRPAETYAFEGVFLTVRDLYQLADDSRILPEGYIYEESYGVSLGAIITPIDLLELRAGVQSYFDREYTFYNAGGHEVASYDVDPSVGFYGSVNFKF